MTTASQKTLNQLVKEIQEFNTQTVAIRVICHTSKSGSASFNQSRGLKHNIVAEGKGFYLPISVIIPEYPRQQRTEIRLVRIN
ncbi:MAG: hypothetical protein F6K10_16835 [Moorea sp. SIO2B7]|nr:hypothetical protein [Moorena sp. SIO2B7]